MEPSGRVLVFKENLVEVDAPAVPGVHMVRMRERTAMWSVLVHRASNTHKAANCERSARERSRDQPPHVALPVRRAVASPAALPKLSRE